MIEPEGRTGRRKPFRLGDLEVFPDRGEIVRDGKAVRVEPLSMRLLLLLTERYPDTVTRDEIIARLWDGRVVTDAAISRQVAKLRRALDDRPADGAFVQTVPKVGLRMKRAAEPLTPGVAGVPPPRRTPLIAGLAGFAVALLGLGGFAVWRLYSDPPPPAEIPLTASPLTERDPSLSHNGAWAAYVGASGPPGDPNSGEVIIRTLADDTVTRLPVGAGTARHPTWSPADDAIAYVHLGAEGCRLKVASFPALAVRDVGACADGVEGGLAWATENRLVLSERRAADQPYRLVEIDLERGVRRDLTDPPAFVIGDVKPVAGTEGELYFIRRHALESTSLIRMDLRTGRLRTLLGPHRGIWSAAPLRGGGLLIAGVGPDGGDALWRFRPGSRDLERLTAPGRYWKVSTSDDGKAVFERPTYRISLWSWSGGTEEPRRITGTTQADWSPTLSPDGKEIAFLSTRNGPNHQIWIVARQGGEPMRLTELSQSTLGEMAWRPDGSAIVVSALAGQGYDLIEVDRANGRNRRLTRDRGDETQPAFSRDGKTLFFVRVGDGRSDLVALTLANGREETLLRNVAGVRSMPDGRLLIKPLNEVGLSIVDPGRSISRLAPGGLAFNARNWAFDGQVLSVVAPGRGIVRRALGDGSAEDELPMRAARVFLGSGIDADRSGVVYSRADDFDIDIYRLELNGRR